MRRVYAAYLGSGNSQLTFWHSGPEVNPNFKNGKLSEYYMPFLGKANYQGHYDQNGIPKLDYHGEVGLQYNPIAIAQYGLGNFNHYHRSKQPSRKEKFLKVSDWLVENLEQNQQGVWVWNHHFDWEYRDTLKAPWYSALAQGQGISVLVRAHQVTSERQYLTAAEHALVSFDMDIAEGGVKYVDDQGYVWFEEAVVDPPTHILNGFIWALWGLYDHYIYTEDSQSEELFNSGVRTLEEYISDYDIGFWSLYEQSGTRLKMIASPFYHDLHIVQLKVMERLTGRDIFSSFAKQWNRYKENLLNRYLALGYKAIFKFLYY